VTYDDMTKRVQAYIGLQDIASFSELAFVQQLIYEGTLDLLARTKCVVRCVQLRVQANQDEYTLDHGILALVDLENGARRRARRDEAPSESAFTLIRSDLLLVKPTPSADGQVQVWAVMRPQAMTQPTDTPAMESFGAIPDEFQDAIVTYALWHASDYADDATGQQGERYRILYEGQDGRGGRLAQIRSQVNRRGTAKGPPRKARLQTLDSYSAWVG
jgi:hypothetical protein